MHQVPGSVCGTVFEKMYSTTININFVDKWFCIAQNGGLVVSEIFYDKSKAYGRGTDMVNELNILVSGIFPF